MNDTTELSPCRYTIDKHICPKCSHYGVYEILGNTNINICSMCGENWYNVIYQNKKAP
jgi:ribosomal protein L37AE/L43A